MVQPCDGKRDSFQLPTNSKILNHEPKSQVILLDIGLKYSKFAGKGHTCQLCTISLQQVHGHPHSVLEEDSECLL